MMSPSAARSGAIAALATPTATRKRFGKLTVAQQCQKNPRPHLHQRPALRLRQAHRRAPRRRLLLLLRAPLAAESVRGSHRLISTLSSQISTMRPAPGQTSSLTMHLFREQRHSLASPTRVTSIRISMSLPHSWDRRAMRRPEDGQRLLEGPRHGAIASRRNAGARAALAQATVLLATLANHKASIALALPGRLTKAVDLCSSAGITTMAPSASTFTVTPPCSSMIRRGWPPMPRLHTRRAYGSG